MPDRFQILSLDGGGLKGLFSAAVLAFFEEDHKTNITDHFDLIVGTSTGGIIALALGLGMKPKDIIHFYVKEGPSIFPESIFYKGKQFFTSKYGPGPLETVLKNYFGEKQLRESNKRLVIPSYNISDDDIYLFKTPHHERLKRDYKVPAWKIGMATSAAPTYLPSFQKLDHLRLVDGGVWANNPAMLGIVEATSLLDQSLNSIRVLSIGTTDAVSGRPNDLNRGGFWQWKNQSTEVIMRGQSIGTSAMVRHLLGDDNFLRIDPKVPDELFALDKLSEDELLAKAANESRKFSPQFSKEFLDHIAPNYTPIYK